jgi:tellurite resistance-related uncharacterized protein
VKAVIDRFEGDLAVLIVGEEEQRMNVPRKLLPKQAKEGSWLQLDILDGMPHSITLDDQETENVKHRIAKKLARLRRGDYK